MYIFCNLHKIHSPQFATPLGYNWGQSAYSRSCKPSKKYKKQPISTKSAIKHGASGDTELFEKASNINGFQGGRVANNLYISPFRATVFQTAALFLYPNSSVVIRVENLLFHSLWLAL